MQVPVTHTFSSRNKQAKDLADSNALKIQQKEILEREIRELVASKEEIIRKIGFIPAEYEKARKEHLVRTEEMENRAVKAKIETQRLETAVTDIRESLRVMSTQEGNLTKTLEKLNSDIKTLSERKTVAEGSTLEAERKYGSLITEKSLELSKLTISVNKTKEANAQITRDIEKRMQAVVEQERLASIRRNDLEIYETRLRKKYPNDPIIL